MKKPILLLSALALILACSCITIAYAGISEGSLESGYYVIANLPEGQAHGGTTVTITAQTTDPLVVEITFIWKNPLGDALWTDTVPVQPDGTYNGKTIYSAVSIHNPADHGEWQVEVLFLTAEGSCQSRPNIKPRVATSFFVVPEIPIIGTAGASLAMFAGLAVKMKRKPRN